MLGGMLFPWSTQTVKVHIPVNYKILLDIPDFYGAFWSFSTGLLTNKQEWLTDCYLFGVVWSLDKQSSVYEQRKIALFQSAYSVSVVHLVIEMSLSGHRAYQGNVPHVDLWSLSVSHLVMCQGWCLLLVYYWNFFLSTWNHMLKLFLSHKQMQVVSQWNTMQSLFCKINQSHSVLDWVQQSHSLRNWLIVLESCIQTHLGWCWWQACCPMNLFWGRCQVLDVVP